MSELAEKLKKFDDEHAAWTAEMMRLIRIKNGPWRRRPIVWYNIYEIKPTRDAPPEPGA